MSGDTVRIEDGVPWVCDRSFPWAQGITVHDADTSLGSWRTRRFLLPFENGWSLSIIFGSGTYCVNYDSYGGEFTETPTTVEVACWTPEPNGDLVGWDTGDTVRGHVTAPALLALIDEMMGWPSKPPAGFKASIPEMAS